MTTTTVTGGYSITQTGTPPNVEMQLMSASYGYAATNVYEQYPIQQSPWFVVSFQLKMSGGADEVFFAAGATGPLSCGVSCPGSNNGAVVIGFDIYGGFGGGAGVFGPGIYLMNAAGAIVASAKLNVGDGTWQTFTITYAKGTSNTWVVAKGGSTTPLLTRFRRFLHPPS